MNDADPAADPATPRGGSRRTAGGTSKPSAALVVEELAGSALLQDLGRSHVSVGVPVGGAFDRRAHRLALTLVGDRADQATLEVVGSITVRAQTRVLVAVSGPPTLTLRHATLDAAESVDSPDHASWAQVPGWTVLELGVGEALHLSAAGRAYLAVRGGVQCERVLGSRSTCLLGPIGPAPVVQGQVLLAGTATDSDARAGDFCRPPARTGPHAVVPGPHRPLHRVEVRVVDASRIGTRLAPRGAEANDGGARAARTDLPSFGVLPGTIQELPSGDWMLLGPDAGTMGGYPVIGVLAGDGLDRWAHVRPGDLATLVPTSAATSDVRALEAVVRVGEIG